MSGEANSEHVKLDEIAMLERNWDGYDACTFKPETIANARRVLNALIAAGFTPEVGPLPNGSVGFEWGVDDGSFIEVGSTSAVGHVS